MLQQVVELVRNGWAIDLMEHAKASACKEECKEGVVQAYCAASKGVGVVHTTSSAGKQASSSASKQGAGHASKQGVVHAIKQGVVHAS